GSVAVGVPTPKLPWVLVSFEGQSAPFLLTLPAGSEGSFRVSGKPGDFKLSLQDPFSGWLRVAYPFGAHEFSTNSAGELGQLVSRFQRVADLYLAPVPTLDGLDI